MAQPQPHASASHLSLTPQPPLYSYDQAFTSNKLARALDEQGVGLVGMQKTSGRPKEMPRGGAFYWPFSGRTKAEETEYERGSRREAYTKLPEWSRLKWLKAELWLDGTWVTMLATTFFSAAPTTVLRWTAERRLLICHAIAVPPLHGMPR